jgi:AraC family transcriptional regulator
MTNTTPARDETRQTYQQRILAALMYAQRHLDDEELSLEELARVAHFSPFHFHRIFRGMVGESVNQHVRRLRLERAASQLKRTDQPVLRIALDAGYAAHESFTRAFADMFGMPPARYRQVHQATPAAAQDAAVSKVHWPEEVIFTPRQYNLNEHPVRIEKCPPRRVVFIRHVGPYDGVGRAWQTLIGWAMPRGLFVGPSSTMIGIVHDDPRITPSKHVRYDACLAIAEGRVVEPEGEIGVQEIAGGDHAVVTHRGPYEKLSQTYDILFGGWLPASGREPAATPAFERYLNSPYDAAPDDLLTEIHLPLTN